MTRIIQQVKVCIEKHLNTDHTILVVALSGGVDSMVLLHVLTQIRSLYYQDLNIAAIHVNHNLQQESHSWLEFCKKVCTDLQVTFFAQNVQINLHLSSVEQQARDARYKSFGNVLISLQQQFINSNIQLLTAHHADDQLETLLFRVFRGTGINGLGCIPELSYLKFYTNVDNLVVDYTLQPQCSNIALVRPLLAFTKLQILSFAKIHDITYVTDMSNYDNKYTRNIIRNKIIPTIKQYFPQAHQSAGNLIANALEAKELLNILACADMHTLEELQDLSSWFADKLIKIPRLLFSLTSCNEINVILLNAQRRKNVLIHWIVLQLEPIPSVKHLNNIVALFNSNSNNAVIKLSKGYIYYYNGYLLYMPIIFINTTRQPCEITSDTLYINASEQIVCKNTNKDKRYFIKYRQGGETININNQNKELKKLLQQANIPTCLRDKIPLLADEHGDIIAIANTRFVANSHTGIFLQWYVNITTQDLCNC